MTAVAERGTTIARVRLRGGGGDPLGAQLRAAQMLAQTGDLSDTVPAAAILCVRRLCDPRPGQVALAQRAAPPGWTRAVRERVRDLARGAARPARETADGAEAVIFADHAELLACLARDWCRGALGRWWWRPLVGDGAGLDAVVRAWLDRPTQLAAALEHAASMHVAADFVRHLPPSAARALFEAVVASHALVGLTAATGRDPIPDAPVRTGERRGIDAGDSPSAAPGASARAPWHACAPEAAASTLRRDQQLVLGVALAVRRAPVHARSAAFAAAVARWWTDPAATRASGTHPVASSAGREAPGVTREPGPAPPDLPAVHAVAAPGAVDAAAEPGSWAEPRADVPAAGATLAAAAILVEPTREVVAGGPAVGASIATRYAGVFYLLNVALALELYGDFTRPATRGLDLSIWDFVALVGQALLPGDAVDRDPVWRLLATLAGRDPGARPGEGFDPPAAWRVADAWLHAFPERDDWRWATTSDRLRVRHPAGFLVVDVPRAPARAAVQVEEELAPHRARARRAARAMSAPTPADPLDRWLAWIVPYVRARLARALGASHRAGVGHTVCRAAGRVCATATRVDVVLPLAGQPIALRLGGLDRDPGWIPAADRTVAFRFE